MSGEESARSSLETPGEDIHAGGSGSNPLPEHHIEHPFRDLPPAPPTGPTTGPTPGAGTVAQATFPPTVAAPNIITHGGEHGVSASGKRGNVVSGTWTLSSGDYADLSEADDADTRDEFVKEYNYLAKKHGIRPLVPGHYTPPISGQNPAQQRRSWFSRTFLRQASGTSEASSTKSDKKLKSRRSVGDLAMQFMSSGPAKRDSLKDEDLDSLVRLCGKSKLTLPSEYSPGPLTLPTCIRATAQYLTQHGTEIRGVFRIPGSVRVVNELYAHYCADGNADAISSTTHAPNLPSHIKAGAHDVASTFKRLISGLPGGILGSVSLFDALVNIYEYQNKESETPQPQDPRVRAKLIALAISAVKSELRRDLICAVFGLLCLIGHAAEKASLKTPSEGEGGQPVPGSDFMGYNALGIVFGPILLGDLLGLYNASSSATAAATGSAQFPEVLPDGQLVQNKGKAPDDGIQQMPLGVDNIHLANSVTEMVLNHWRGVVDQMKRMDALKAGVWSASDEYTLRVPRDQTSGFGGGESSAPPSPTRGSRKDARGNPRSSLILPRRRPRSSRPLSSGLAGVEASLLSPPVEEASPAKERSQTDDGPPPSPKTPTQLYAHLQGMFSDSDDAAPEPPSFLKTPVPSRPIAGQGSSSATSNPNLWHNVGNRFRTVSKGSNPFKRKHHKEESASDSASRGGPSKLQKTPVSKAPHDTPTSAGKSMVQEKTPGDGKNKLDVFSLGRSRLTAWRARHRTAGAGDTDSPVLTPGETTESGGEKKGSGSSLGLPLKGKEPVPKPSLTGDSQTNLSQDVADLFKGLGGNTSSPMGSPSRMKKRNSGQRASAPGYDETSTQGLSPHRHAFSEITGSPSRAQDSADSAEDQDTQAGEMSASGRKKPLFSQQRLQQLHQGSPRIQPLGPRPDPSRSQQQQSQTDSPAGPSSSRPRPVRAGGSGAVRAMAAMFESAASQDSHSQSHSKSRSRSQSRASSPDPLSLGRNKGGDGGGDKGARKSKTGGSGSGVGIGSRAAGFRSSGLLSSYTANYLSPSGGSGNSPDLSHQGAGPSGSGGVGRALFPPRPSPRGTGDGGVLGQTSASAASSSSSVVVSGYRAPRTPGTPATHGGTPYRQAPQSTTGSPSTSTRQRLALNLPSSSLFMDDLDNTATTPTTPAASASQPVATDIAAFFDSERQREEDEDLLQQQMRNPLGPEWLLVEELRSQLRSVKLERDRWRERAEKAEATLREMTFGRKGGDLGE